MKKLRCAAIFALLLLAMLFSRALPRRDLRATAQVAGIALDEVNGTIKATFELYDAEPEQPIGARKKVLSSYGQSIEECVREAYRIFGKSLFASDASVLLIAENSVRLKEEVLRYYSKLAHDQMDLPVFFTTEEAGAIFGEEGKVLSNDLLRSAKALHKVQTVRDLMNGSGEPVRVQGKGYYEILS